MVWLSNLFKSPIFAYRRPSTPSVRRPSVWPLPSSLATTKGIEFSFFSSGYLDVSLPRVPPVNLWIQLTVTGQYPGRVPPFGNPRITAYLRLPQAYRSLSRPSSAISAMASTLRSCSLDLALLQHPFLRLLRKVLKPLCLFACLISRFLDTRRLEFLTSFDFSLSFFISLCSFQGALKFRTSAFCFFRSFKTIQRSTKNFTISSRHCWLLRSLEQDTFVPLWLSPLLFLIPLSFLHGTRPWNPSGLFHPNWSP